VMGWVEFYEVAPLLSGTLSHLTVYTL